MRILFTTIITLYIVCSCNNKEVETLTIAPQNETISKRSLDQQASEKFNFTTEQQWDSLNNNLDNQTPLKKEKFQLNEPYIWLASSI